MKFEEMNFEEKENILDKELEVAKNLQRHQQAIEFHKKFHERMQNINETEQEER